MKGENYVPRTGNGSQNYCHTLYFYLTIRIINIILVARKSSETLDFNFFSHLLLMPTHVNKFLAVTVIYTMKHFPHCRKMRPRSPHVVKSMRSEAINRTANTIQCLH